MEGGSDTTSTFLQWFVTLVTAHPLVQRKLQEEIDVVVGSDRVPAFEDFERLPYLQVHLPYCIMMDTDFIIRLRSKKSTGLDLSFLLVPLTLPLMTLRYV
jgi:hypothetical protein